MDSGITLDFLNQREKLGNRAIRNSEARDSLNKIIEDTKVQMRDAAKLAADRKVSGASIPSVKFAKTA
jgi:hypothetical protein